MAKGYGCRSGAAYKPWRNFRSRPRVGTERAFRCSKTGRLVNHKSCAHKVYFLLQERRDNVVSIEEEFPLLHIAQTLGICHRLGLEQPKKNKLPEPLVTDFLVREVRDGLPYVFARSLSKESPAAKEGVSHLDAILEACARLGIEWKLVDPGPLDQTMLNSLMFARAWLQRRFKAEDTEVRRFVASFLKHHRRSATLLDLLEACTADLGLTVAAADTLFRYAAWRGLIPVDFRFKLARNEVVHLIRDGRT